MFRKLWNFYVRHNLKIGLLLTAIGLWLTIAPPSQNPHLTYYHQSFDLVELKESNENLKIYFKGTDIKQAKQNLKVFAVTLVNDGRSDVKIEDYDSDYPFGIQIKNGFATGLNIKADKDSYVGKRFYQDENEDSTKILFNKIIIKAKQKIKFEITVIHKEGTSPELTTLGKIANTNIEIEQGEEKTDTDWWGLIKGLAIFVMVIGGAILIVIAIYWIVVIISSLNRNFKIKSYYGYNYNHQNKTQRVIVTIYKELGKADFLEIMEIFKYPPILNEKYLDEIQNKSVVDRFNKLRAEGKVLGREVDKKYKSKLLDIIDILDEAKLIEGKSDNTVTLKQEFIDEITEVLGYIKKEKTEGTKS